MDRETYITTQKKILDLARQVRELPLEEMIDAIKTTETIAPIVDPTAWRHGAKNLAIVRQLAEAALQFKAAFPDVAAVLEGALEANALRGEPGGGFADFNPPDPLADIDPSKLRRAGARAFPAEANQ